MRYLNLIIISILILVLAIFGKDIIVYFFNSTGILKDTGAIIESISLGGDMKIFIDGVEKGVVRGSQSKFELDGISNGVHKVELSKISDLPFPKFTTTLNFLDGFATTVAYEIGPSESVSQGWTIEPVEKDSVSDQSTIEIITNIESSSVKLFDEDTNGEIKPLGESVNPTYNLDFKSGYKVSIEKDGYLPVTFNIFGYDAGSEKILEKAKKYNYIIKVYLFELPLKINYL